MFQGGFHSVLRIYNMAQKGWAQNVIKHVVDDDDDQKLVRWCAALNCQKNKNLILGAFVACLLFSAAVGVSMLAKATNKKDNETERNTKCASEWESER